MAKDEEIIAALLLFIKQHTGVDVHADEYFKGIRIHRGEKYVNVELQQRTSESIEYQQLERFQGQYSGVITRVEPNGARRVAIFFDADKLHL